VDNGGSIPSRGKKEFFSLHHHTHNSRINFSNNNFGSILHFILQVILCIVFRLFIQVSKFHKNLLF